MERIASFSVDHDYITPGVYLSRRDGDVDTYDLRTRRPNAGDYMDNLTMHSVEHLFATYARGGAWGKHVIYFGPMGCRTGFYLLLRGLSGGEAWEMILSTLRACAAHEGEMPGAHRKECGNYRGLSLEAGRRECAAYLKVLEEKGCDYAYPTAERR